MVTLGTARDGIGPNHFCADANTASGSTSPVTTSVALLGAYHVR